MQRTWLYIKGIISKRNHGSTGVFKYCASIWCSSLWLFRFPQKHGPTNSCNTFDNCGLCCIRKLWAKAWNSKLKTIISLNEHDFACVLISWVSVRILSMWILPLAIHLDSVPLWIVKKTLHLLLMVCIL